ncbi:prolyl oligopeptidase family serine peptidase [Methylobacterium sp. Leaf108]|uniref:prolyl oligopeptidase family serine peptidase n=1 Tax=Methylobacterium sp. Leaf108 TaxID=1736256 RepID=UPI0006F52E6D|nr:prolyl oligopeptidase family serine peptidase [Methylobacterium sp. Leaf108]KQP51290.1 peptidase S9 [Methylobacterium sp. Leaf108]
MTNPAPPSIDPRPTRQDPDDDPHLWLEAIEGPEAIAWVEARNAETLARVSDATMAADARAALAILDRPDRIPLVARRGGLLYNLWRDAEHPLGLWRRTDEAGYRAGTPAWEVLIDLDALAAAEGIDWVWAGATVVTGSHDRALVKLSRGGGDAVVIREFDLESRSFVVDGFVLPEAKGSCDWLDRDTLILSSALGEGMATRAGYARTVRLWARGTDPLAAPILFETAQENMGLWGGVEHGGSAERVVFAERTGFFDGYVHLGDRTGPTVRLDLPTDAEVALQGDRLAVRTRTEWTPGDRTFAPDTVLAIGLSDFLDGDRGFTVLWQPSERRALQGMSWAGERLIVDALDDLRPGYTVHEWVGGAWTCRHLPGLPSIGSVSVWPLDAEPSESDGSLLAMAQDPLTPPTLLSIAPDLSAPTVLRTTPAAFDTSGLRVTRHEAVSVDGTRIPYVQVGPEERTGQAPVHLSAYGGFQVSLLPTYQAVLGKLWLEKGGTGVVANIRGGGEFGTRWHQAGRREGKALAHEDFAAVAADLVARGVTRPGRIAAQGGSNGGLLIANMLTRHPERFGALFCTIPLIDMRRYAKLLAGASWIAEYGDPDDPDDWSFLGAISAYHTAEPGRPYPPILIATTRRDDRVHPGHARKMAQKLRAMGYDPAFYEPAAGGHGYGKDNAETASFLALGMAFLRRSIGWEPGAA